MSPPRVLVVGGGVSGLAAAHRLRTRLGPEATITVVESARSLGGKLAALDLAGQRLDVGAEAFLARRPEAADRIAELGLADRLVHPGAASSRVRAGGRTRTLPPRTVMGVPADPAAAGPLLSDPARARLAAEADGPPVEWAAGDDVAVGALLRERMGDEIVDRLVDPLLGGVYAGSADLLGLRATVPALATRLDEGARSVTQAARRALPATPPESCSPARTAPAPVFATLRDGLADLPAALALAARAEIVLGRTVTALERTPTGWAVDLVIGGADSSVGVGGADSSVGVGGADSDAGDRPSTGPARERRLVDAVVLAVPPPALRRLLADLAPSAAAAAGAIELASSALVALALPAGTDLGADSGVLVGAGEQRPDGHPWTIKAVTFSSVKWPHLAEPSNPDAPVLLRASIGRHGDPRSTELLQRDDDELEGAARDDLAALTGLTAEPIDSAVVRWGGGLPQYGVGHPQRVAAIEDGVAPLPGLAVAGAALHGVGVPACLATADAAAERVLAHLAGSSPRGSERGAPSLG